MVATGSIGTVAYDIISRDRTKKGLNSAADRAKRVGKIGQNVGAALTGVGVAAAFAVRALTNSFMELDTAMARVRKTTGASTAEIDELKDAFIELSKEMPASAAELAEVGAVAGQLGIKGKANILEFTETASMMATAFDVSSEEAATALAKLSNIYDIPISETDRLASAINALGNTTAAKEGEILAFTGSLGASARMLGFTATESVSMGASLISMGMDASDAGTRLNSAFSVMAQNTEEAGELLGMSGDKFKEAFGQDQIGTINRLIAKIKGIDDSMERTTAATDVFGRIGAKAIIGLSANVDDFATNLDTAASAYELNTSLTEEYANATDTAAAKLKIAKNQLNAAKIALGGQMAPALIFVAKAIGGVANALSNMSPWLQAFISGGILLTSTLAVIGPLLFVASTAVVAWSTASLAAAASGISLTASLSAAAVAAWAFITPLLPFIAIGATIVGILALLEKKFKVVSIATALVTKGFEWGLQVNRKFASSFKPIWDAFSPVFELLKKGVTDYFTFHWNMFKKLLSVTEKVFNGIGKLMAKALGRTWEGLTIDKILGDLDVVEDKLEEVASLPAGIDISGFAGIDDTQETEGGTTNAFDAAVRASEQRKLQGLTPEQRASQFGTLSTGAQAGLFGGAGGEESESDTAITEILPALSQSSDKTNELIKETNTKLDTMPELVSELMKITGQFSALISAISRLAAAQSSDGGLGSNAGGGGL
ncbi:MAG: phage tail tape measure protein [Gammaproteobacteria bacterium]|nr:phage tail tape measure protein [Gammaproteobacteria bacterium]